ncbi:MAG: hypothetical protein LUE88_01915 [Clostridiales bacterium]|nr:hypothetical protein [Clostridiales bacterium]
MDWGKAKKIIIFLLIALNIALFAMNRYYNSDYRLTQAEENAIYKLLSQNGIGIYTELIEEYDPMKQLDVTVASPDIEELKSMFFDEDENVETEIEFDQLILRTYSAEVIAEDSKISFSCPTGYGEISGVGNDAAKKLAQSFMERMRESYSDYVLDRITYKNGGYQLEYYEYYKGYKVFCNYCIFFIDDYGIKSIESENYDINGFVEENRDICASSEAVLTYMYSSSGSDTARFIESIELGYDLRESEEIVDGSKIRLVPCYYIYLLNEDEPFVVYAYTNTARTTTAAVTAASTDSLDEQS